MTPSNRSRLIALSLLLEPRPLVFKYKGDVITCRYTVTFRGQALRPILEKAAARLNKKR